jgi:hypothetical protein
MRYNYSMVAGVKRKASTSTDDAELQSRIRITRPLDKRQRLQSTEECGTFQPSSNHFTDMSVRHFPGMCERLRLR